MHYYQFNIGDYASHTRGLSLFEDLAYRRLLDIYYLQERPLNSGVASVARQIGMADHVDAVKFVLECHFSLTPDGWINTRADKEIGTYHSKIEQASRAGKASAERRSNARSTDVQLNINQEPITNNQEPKKRQRAVVECPSDVDPQIWADYVTLRKAKKAPITQTSLKGIEREAQKAGWSLNQAIQECVNRGWQGFKADWLSTPNKTAKAFPERNLAAARAIFGDERRLTSDNTIIDATVTPAITR